MGKTFFFEQRLCEIMSVQLYTQDK